MFFLFYGGHRIWAWSDSWAYDPAEVDLKTGLDQVLAEEVPARTMNVKGPWWKKITLLWQ
jgi:amino acid transporter